MNTDQTKTLVDGLQATIGILTQQRNGNADAFMNANVNLQLCQKQLEALQGQLAACKATLARPDVAALVSKLEAEDAAKAESAKGKT